MSEYVDRLIDGIRTEAKTLRHLSENILECETEIESLYDAKRFAIDRKTAIEIKLQDYIAGRGDQ